MELPTDRPAPINMLSATNFDQPAFNTRRRTAQHSSSEDTTPQRDVMAPDMTDTQSTTPKSLTADRLEALLQMQKMDPFCKHISLHTYKGTASQTHHRLRTKILGASDPQGMEVHSISGST